MFIHSRLIWLKIMLALDCSMLVTEYSGNNDVCLFQQWSFGVTCWEVFTCGGVPYAGVPAMTLLNELHSGHRLDRPSNTACSHQMYDCVVTHIRCIYEVYNSSQFSRTVCGQMHFVYLLFLRYIISHGDVA